MQAHEIQSKFETTFKSLCGNKHPLDVWREFVVMSAIAISNQCDLRERQVREAEYMALIKPYENSDKRFMFSELLALAASNFIHNGPTLDFFGEVYMRLGISNSATGQFFTPMSITRMMGRLTVNSPTNQTELERKGFLSVCDPAVGAGACLLGALEGLQEQKIPVEKVYMEGWDIDRTAALMAYIQLSLCNVAARIVHGNSLSCEVYSVWYTPAYILGGWSRKLKNAALNMDSKEVGSLQPQPKPNKLVGMEAIRARLYAQ